MLKRQLIRIWNWDTLQKPQIWIYFAWFQHFSWRLVLGCFALTAASWLKLSALFSNPEVNDFPSWEAGERSGRIRIQLPSSAPSGCLLPTQQPRRFVTRRWMISAAWPAALWVRTHTHTHVCKCTGSHTHTHTNTLLKASKAVRTHIHTCN